MSQAKRLRRPKLRDGELRIYWGKEPHDSPDVIMAWQGDASMKRDTNYLHYMLCTKKPALKIGVLDWSDMQPSFIEELQARGYDITTIKFSIMKKGQS